jgi:SAM-dependent methyltransferase
MAQSPIDGPFDRALRRRRRDRAARSGAGPDFLSRRLADELLERLDLVTRPFATALDLGCGAGHLTRRLRDRGIEVVPADAGALYAAAGLQCDEDQLPFPPGAFDLVVSVGALDTVNDLPGALIQIRRALRPDGLFLAAFLGAGSLPRLRRALRAAEEAEGAPAAPRLHPQIDVRAGGDLLARAGFAMPVADGEALDVRYSSFARLVADLRLLAATNILRARAKRPFSRLAYAAAAADFAAEGGTVERFEIVHLSGWAPAPDQPKAAARGSGAVSLAEALKPRG